MKTLFEIVLKANVDVNEMTKAHKSLKHSRSNYCILTSIISEVGELSTEVAIHEGDSYKIVGSDGIIGEGVDVILSILDLIIQIQPNITEQDLSKIAEAKIAKWRTCIANANNNYK